MITAHSPYHGPEFEYIINGYNGVISSGELDDYVNDIKDLLAHKLKYNYIGQSFETMLQLYSTEKDGR